MANKRKKQPQPLDTSPEIYTLSFTVKEKFSWEVLGELDLGLKIEECMVVREPDSETLTVSMGVYLASLKETALKDNEAYERMLQIYNKQVGKTFLISCKFALNNPIEQVIGNKIVDAQAYSIKSYHLRTLDREVLDTLSFALNRDTPKSFMAEWGKYLEEFLPKYPAAEVQQ